MYVDIFSQTQHTPLLSSLSGNQFWPLIIRPLYKNMNVQKLSIIGKGYFPFLLI